MRNLFVSIEIEKYRTSPSEKRWELPPWGHPLSQGVLPLFITLENRLIPVGTAFTIGRGIPFIVSAAHNVREALKYEERLSHLLFTDELPKSIDLREVGICVMHQMPMQNGEIALTVWPLETVDGAPPTDIIFGFPQFQTSFPTLVHRLSFELPTIGDKVWSIGYSDFRYPKNGIPFTDIQNGTFDWRENYCHRLTIVEAVVERIFTQRFASSFIEGPCFSFDMEISHGQSGGPVISADGVVRGVNSAGATHFFNRPTSLASLLYPLLLMQLRFGVTIGPIRLQARRPLTDLIAQGAIATDESEERIGFTHDESSGSLIVNPRSPIDVAQFIHDDFSSFQQGRTATRETKPIYQLRRTEIAEKAD